MNASNHLCPGLLLLRPRSVAMLAPGSSHHTLQLEEKALARQESESALLAIAETEAQLDVARSETEEALWASFNELSLLRADAEREKAAYLVAKEEIELVRGFAAAKDTELEAAKADAAAYVVSELASLRASSAAKEEAAAQAATELALLRASSAKAISQLQSELEAARHESVAQKSLALSADALAALSADALSTVSAAVDNSKSAALLAAKRVTEQAQAELVATREELSKAAADGIDVAADPARRVAAKERSTALRAAHEKKLAALRVAQREMLHALRVALQQASNESVASLSVVKSALAAVEEESEGLRRQATKAGGPMARAGYHIDLAIETSLRPFQMVGGMVSSAFGWESPRGQMSQTKDNAAHSVEEPHAGPRGAVSISDRVTYSAVP